MTHTEGIPGARSDQSIEAAYNAYLTTHDERRKRQLARVFLEMPGAREEIVARLHRASRDERPALWTLVIDAVKARIDADDPEWEAEVVGWLRDGNATWDESADVCADTGFYASLTGKLQPFGEDEISAAAVQTPEGRAKLHLHIAALRLAYRWEEMARCLTNLQSPVRELDPFARAFHVFGLIINGDENANHEMAQLLEVAGDNYRVLLALVEALRLSKTLSAEEQGTRMLELLDRPAMLGSVKADPLYRRAFALRRMGRYEEALKEVNRCLAMLPIERVQDRVRIVQEHDLIVAERTISEQRQAAEQVAKAELAMHAEHLRDMVGEKVEEAQRLISDALFRSVEVLGLFIAIVTLIVTSVGSSAVPNLHWWQRGALIGVAGIVVLAFFFLLRVIVRPRKPRKKKE